MKTTGILILMSLFVFATMAFAKGDDLSTTMMPKVYVKRSQSILNAALVYYGDFYTETDLARVETLLKEREVQLKENNFWLAYISSAEVYNEKLSDIDVYNDWVNNLKSEDFKRLANYYFNEKEFKRFVLNPEK